ncbi:hypothetical protein LP420_01675 [Massilia sp. B-10]|nr:hypothetical protein LP420_01675 [Massilia sp. B-10]
MMLAGEKPFAAFSEYYPATGDDEVIPESVFAPYVASGLFSKAEHFIPGKENRTLRLVLYARNGEEWRIRAYVLVRTTAAKCGWSEGFERMEGSLLGYSDSQNDIFIERHFKASAN